MNTSELIYQGELRTFATHVYSSTQLFTDAPLDNMGKAQSFSPTDLVAVALASCMVTTVAILMRNDEIHLEGSSLSVRKIMASNPRRIASIEIDFRVNNNMLTESLKEKLELIVHECPVAKSIHPDIEQKIVFVYGENLNG
jgi:putative redox protein